MRQPATGVSISIPPYEGGHSWQVGLRSIGSLGFPLTVKLAPVLKFVFIYFGIEFHNSGAKTLLNIRDRLVVNERTDFFQKISEKRASNDVANLLIHIFLKISLD